MTNHQSGLSTIQEMVFLGNGKFECYTCGKTSHNWHCRWGEKLYCSPLCRIIDINDQLLVAGAES